MNIKGLCKKKMKKLLNFLGTITLIGTSTTSLISCNKTNNSISCEKENHGNWKQLCSMDKPFNNKEIKWYFVIWRGGKKYDWKISGFVNDYLKTNQQISSTNDNNYYLQKVVSNYDNDLGIVKNIGGPLTSKFIDWIDDNGTYFKVVYRWDGDESQPEIPIIDPKTGEVIDWKEDKEAKEDKEVKKDR